MSLKGFLDLFNLNAGGEAALRVPTATGSLENKDENDGRIAYLERKVDIQEKAMIELLDSTVKSFRAITVISHGFNLEAQKGLSSELAEMERIEDFVLHHSLAKRK